jgi:hypothetical protein
MLEPVAPSSSASSLPDSPEPEASPLEELSGAGALGRAYTTRKTAIGGNLPVAHTASGALRLFSRSAPCRMRCCYTHYPQRTRAKRALRVFVDLDSRFPSAYP